MCRFMSQKMSSLSVFSRLISVYSPRSPECMIRLSLKIRRVIAGSVLMLFVPIAIQAASVAEILRTPDDRTVSRGEFVRAAVTVLGFPLKDDRKPLPFKRPVPKGLQLHVRAAEKKGALQLFGSDLLLSRAITRGEALFVVMKLQGLKPASVPVHFPDVEKGSALEQAVQVATEKGWMDPVRTNFFGVTRALTGREARVLQRKVIGEGERNLDGVDANQQIPSIIIRFKTREQQPLPQEDVLRAVWQLLNDQFLYKEKIKDDEAAYRAAEALVQSLADPYTTFMRPLPAQEFQNRLDGEVSGIGAQVEFKDNILTIVSPIRGSPAEKAGLQPGDQILKVDGETLAGLDFLGAVSKVRGPKGSTAKLTIRRSGNELEISVVRDVVKVPEIEINLQGDIAVVKLIQFGERTRSDLRSLLMEVQTHHPRGIILDLRSNPGGLLDAADQVVSNFLPQGSPVASINYRDRSTVETTADPPTIDPDVKVIVLVNKGSASASEIVAGALQDSKRATIVGEQTFGKGTVQEIIEFKNGASMKLTIAEWKTPSGRKIDGVGVTPDIVVPTSDGRDEQMLRALELVR